MNENWMTVTTDAVIDEMTEREVESLRTVKGRDALGGILERVVERVRGAVFAGGTALAPEAGTIPKSLAGDAVAIARWRFLISVSKNEALQTEDRRKAHEAAEARLALVEKGELKVQPGTAGSDPAGAVSPKFAEKTLGFDRASQDGL